MPMPTDDGSLIFFAYNFDEKNKEIERRKFKGFADND